MSINPYESAQPGHPWHVPPIEKKHSGPGIASFVLSILVGLLIFGMFIVAGVLAASQGRALREDSMEAIAVGLAVIGLIFLDFVALALGIAGLCQSNRQKVFAALGTLFSFAIAAGTIGLIAVGMAMKD